MANPENTSHVVKSREDERFVSKIHDHWQELRCGSELLAHLQESGQKWRKKSDQKPEGNLGISKHEGNLCRPCHPYSKSIPVHWKNHSYEWEKWKVIHAHSPDGGHLAASVSKMVTAMLRHFDQEEQPTDGSRHGDSIEPVLTRASAHEGAQDFSDENWLRLIFMRAAPRKGSNIANMKMGIDVICELFRDTLVVFQ